MKFFRITLFAAFGLGLTYTPSFGQQLAALAPTSEAVRCQAKLSLEETHETKVALEENEYPETATPVLAYALRQIACLEGESDVQISLKILSIDWDWTPGGAFVSVFTGIFGGPSNSLGSIKGKAAVEITVRAKGKVVTAQGAAEEKTLYKPEPKMIIDDRPALPIGGGWSRPNNKVGGMLLNQAISQALKKAFEQL
jgi:hypothetical protein